MYQNVGPSFFLTRIKIHFTTTLVKIIITSIFAIIMRPKIPLLLLLIHLWASYLFIYCRIHTLTFNYAESQLSAPWIICFVCSALSYFHTPPECAFIILHLLQQLMTETNFILLAIPIDSVCEFQVTGVLIATRWACQSIQESASPPPTQSASNVIDTQCAPRRGKCEGGGMWRRK